MSRPHPPTLRGVIAALDLAPAFSLCLACNAPAEIDPTFGANPSGVSFDEISTSLPTTTDGDGSSGTPTTGDRDGSADASSGGPTCGNGVLEDGELCDDGNADDSDACTTSCVPAACGDGAVQVQEECDEGVHNGPGMPCTILCKVNVCGDGDRGPDEPCDDGNMDDKDACTSLCQLATCGDGIVQAGVETCDTYVTSETCDGDCTQAECGDRFTNPVAGEECDDGNDSNLDNCHSTCRAPTMRIFVTSELYMGDLGGLAGADTKCQSLADKAGLTGTFKAWLGTFEVPPTTRLYHSPGRYKRVDGVVVADSFEQLMNGPLYAQVTIAETGESIDKLDLNKDDYWMYTTFWSGEADKKHKFDDNQGDANCADWTSSSAEHMGSTTTIGVPGYGADLDGYTWNNCDTFHHPLLCVQQAWYPEDPKPL